MPAGRRLIGQIDRPLAMVLVALCLLGLYNLASAGLALGTGLYVTQATHMVIGFTVMFLVASVDYRHYEALAVPIFVTIVALLVLTSFAGKTINGSRRWLVIPGLFNLQTSDLAKLGVILIVAKLLHTEGGRSGGLTLNDIFRPLNISRPILLIAGVLVLTLAGESIRPPKLKRQVGRRARTVLTLTAEADNMVIGSAPDCDVRLRHAGIEPKHVELLRVDESTWMLRDLATASGTYVNGDRITEDHRLRDGDVLRVGLSPRAELSMSHFMERLRPVLPWVAILGAVWLFAAGYRQLRRGRLGERDLVAPIDVVAIPCVLILIQPDLGTTLVILMIAFSIILYVGLRPLSFVLLTGVSLISGVIAWLGVLKPYQKERVMTFLNPASDPLGAGYHQHQSLIAIGSGELWGKGHGQGTQTQLRFLPEQQTDFIFSVWAEEHGFVGCMIVVLLFAAFVLLSLRIATQAKDRFGAMLVVGVTAMIFWHALINMLMVLRLAPVVGVPLPLWSYGGSFLVTTLIGVGVIFNVGMRRFVF